MPRYSDSIRDEALRLYVDEKMSAAAVARKLSLKSFTIKEWADAAGVIRSMSEAAALAIGNGAVRGRSIKLDWRSAKTGRIEPADSLYEAIRMYQHDHNPGVYHWRRCYDVIPYISSLGSTRRYMPDITVIHRDGIIVIEEVKPEKFLDKGENPSKFAAARKFYGVRGVAYRIVTEADLDLSKSRHVFFQSISLDVQERSARKEARRKERMAEMYENETDEERQARRMRQNEKAKRRRDIQASTKTAEELEAHRLYLNEQARRNYRKRQQR